MILETNAKFYTVREFRTFYNIYKINALRSENWLYVYL